MKRARLAKEQIVAVLRKHQLGAKTADLARKHGVSEAQQLKALGGNPKLKKLLAEQMLDAAALRGLPQEKWWRLAAKHAALVHLEARMGLSERRACTIVGADRRMIRYRSRRPPDTELRAKLRELADVRRRFGYRRLLFCCAGKVGHPGSFGPT